MVYNPEVRRKSYLKHKEKVLKYSKEYNLKLKFNLSTEAYSNLLKEQNGVCAICSRTCTRSLAVDHNHTTGKIRGLLCNKCNRGLGYLQDDINLVEKALQYLRKYECKVQEQQL